MLQRVIGKGLALVETTLKGFNMATNANKTATATTLSNAQRSTLIDAIKADKSAQSAMGSFVNRVAAMRESGWTADLIKTHRPAVLEIIANVVLTKAELKLYSDATLATTAPDPRDKSKRIKTAKGVAANKASQALARVSAALSAEPTKEGDKKGARGNNRPLVERLNESLQTSIKRIRADADKEAPELGKVHKELLAAFQATVTRLSDLTSKH